MVSDEDFGVLDERVLEHSARMLPDPSAYTRYYARVRHLDRDAIAVVMVDPSQWGTYTRGAVAIASRRDAYWMSAADLPRVRSGASCTMITMFLDPETGDLLPIEQFEDYALTMACGSETPLVTPPGYGYGGPPD